MPQLKGLQSPLQSRYEKIFTDKIGVHDYIPIHVLATKGFEWSKNNFEKVKDDFIVLRDEELKYFEECYRASGNSWFTFNQFLGFFRNGKNDFIRKELNDETNRYKKKPLKVVAFRTRVGNINAFTASMKVRDLLNISTVSHKRASNIYEVDEYIQGYYQRILKKSRLNGPRGLPAFIKEKNQAFVNNLLINYRGKQSLEKKFKELKDLGEGRGGELVFDTLSPGMFHLIDGQHRLFGYSPLLELDENSMYGDHELIITLFNNLSPKGEARIFLNINENQKPIDAGLKYQVNLIFGDDGPPETVIENIASSIVEGFTVSVGDKDANRINSPFLSPRAIKDTENIKIIDSKTGEEEAAGALTFRAMVTEIKKSRLISQKGHGYKTGLGYKKDYASTIEKISMVYKKYFEAIRTANESLWVMKTADNKEISNSKKIARNYIIGGLILLLDRFIKKEDIQQNSNIYSLIEHHVDKLCEIISLLKTDDEDNFFGTQKYGDGGSAAYDLYLTETYFKELLTDKDKKEIAKRKDDIKKSLIKDPQLIEKIKQLEEVIDSKNHALKELENNQKEKNNITQNAESEKNRNQLAQIYEKEFKTLLHHFLLNHYGESYWTDVIEKFAPETDIPKALAAKSQIENAHLDQGRSKYKHELSYLNTEHLSYVLKGIMKKDLKVKSKIQKFWEISYGALNIEEKDYDPKKKKNSFYFLILVNVLRRFNESGHSPVAGDIDPTKEIEVLEFNYFSDLMDEKIKNLKNSYLK